MTSAADLISMLKDLNVYTSLETTFNPDYQNILQIYEKFCQLINHEENYQIENSLLSLLYRCKLMCRTVGIHDFQLTDLIDPEPKKLKLIVQSLCKYCFWQKEEIIKWQTRISEIDKLEHTEIRLGREQLKQNEDALQQAMLDQAMKKERAEELRLNRQKLQQDLEVKKENKIQLQNKFNKDSLALQDMKDKTMNNMEKLKVCKNELFMLENQIVKDPQKLEQKLQESKQRTTGLEQELDKHQKEKKLEEFRIKVYRRFQGKCHKLIQQLQLNEQIQSQIQQENQQHQKTQDQIIQQTRQIGQLKEQIQKAIQDKQRLVQQKEVWLQQDMKQKQQSLQSLKDLQQQLDQRELEQKQIIEQLQKLRIEKNRLLHSVNEAEQIQIKIQQNLNEVIKQQVNEVQQYTKTIDNLIQKIHIE